MNNKNEKKKPGKAQTSKKKLAMSLILPDPLLENTTQPKPMVRLLLQIYIFWNLKIISKVVYKIE